MINKNSLEIAESGKLIVNKTVFGMDLQVGNKDEIIEVSTFKTEPAYLDLRLGATINLGNYETARIDIGLKLPCYKEEIEDVYKIAKDWLINKLQQEYQEIFSSLKG